MKRSSYSWITGLIAGLSALSAFSPGAHAGWSVSTYTISNRVCTPPNSTPMVSTGNGQVGGSPAIQTNNPSGGTVKATYTWTPEANNPTAPADVYVLQYGNATWKMSPPPAAMMSEPSFQEASFSPRRQGRLQLLQAQAGNGSASNGLGHAQVLTTDGNNWKVGTSQGYKVLLLHPDANGTLTVPDVTLLATATTGPGQYYMASWTYGVQLLNLAITCNGQDITSPKPAYSAYAGQNTALAFSFSGATASDITEPAWSLPDKYVKDWTHSNTSATVVPVLATELASTGIPKVFWVSGGNKTIGFTAKIKGAPVSLTGVISVNRPSHTFTSSPTGTIKIGSDIGYGDNNLRIHYGDPSAATAGITYAANPYPQPNNSLKIVQLMTNNTMNVIDDNGFPQSWTPTSGLDEFPAFASDAPDLLLSLIKEVTIAQSFQAWLMYYPPVTGSEHDTWIYVPLKQLSWSWSTHAKRRGASWTATSTVDANNITSDIMSAVPAQAATGADTLVHPTWTQYVRGGNFQ